MTKRSIYSLLLTAVFLSSMVYYSTGKISQVSYTVFEGQNGWGYNILINNDTIIHQDIVPAISTSKGFDTREQAVKAATLVVWKIKKRKPPVIYQTEICEIISN